MTIMNERKKQFAVFILTFALLLLSGCQLVETSDTSCLLWAQSQVPEEIPLIKHPKAESGLYDSGLWTAGFSWNDGANTVKPPNMIYELGGSNVGENVNYLYPRNPIGPSVYGYEERVLSTEGVYLGDSSFQAYLVLKPVSKELFESAAEYSEIMFEVVEARVESCSRI